jgi:hypothetical protein
MKFLLVALLLAGCVWPSSDNAWRETYERKKTYYEQSADTP